MCIRDSYSNGCFVFTPKIGVFNRFLPFFLLFGSSLLKRLNFRAKPFFWVGRVLRLYSPYTWLFKICIPSIRSEGSGSSVGLHSFINHLLRFISLRPLARMGIRSSEEDIDLHSNLSRFFREKWRQIGFLAPFFPGLKALGYYMSPPKFRGKLLCGFSI